MKNDFIDFIKKHWGLILVIILPIFAILPLFNSGFFSIHDDEQIARLYELDFILKAGQFPPRWIPNLGFGYGYPLFNFYPPFVYYLAELFHLIGFSLIDSTKIVMGLGFILPSLFMYLWVRNHYNVLSGVFSSVLYTYASYHTVDLYVRGALSEFFSFVWIPAVFWSFDTLVKKKTVSWVILSSLFLSFVILTHNLVAMQFIMFFVIYLIFLIIVNRKDFKKIIILLLFAGGLSLGLTAYFWLPSILEKSYTLVDTILTKELANYSIHFVCPIQLWYSPWGYAGSGAGCIDGISFQVGKVQLILSLLNIFIVIFLFLKKKGEESFYNLLVLTLFIISLFMMIPLSKPIWDNIQPFSYLQFPWRFLLFAVLFSSFLAGAALNFLLKTRVSKVLIFIFTLMIISFVIWKAFPYLSPQKYLNKSDKDYTTETDLKWRVSKMSFEYIPKGVAVKKSKIGTTMLDISKDQVAKASYKAINGLNKVKIINDLPQKKEFIVNSEKGGILQINTFSFPGWKVFIDNEEVEYSDNNRLKLIDITIPGGEHNVSILFTETAIRKIGNSISIIALVIVLLMLFKMVFIKAMFKAYKILN